MMATMALVLPTFWGRRSYLYPDGPLGGQLCVPTGWHVGAGRCWARMGGAWEVLLQRDAGRPAALLCGGGRPCRGHTVAPVALRWRCARPEAADMCDRGRTAWRLRSLSPRKQHWRLVALATPLIIVTDSLSGGHFLAELLLLLFAAALRQHHVRSEYITKASGKLSNELNGPGTPELRCARSAP